MEMIDRNAFIKDLIERTCEYKDILTETEYVKVNMILQGFIWDIMEFPSVESSIVYCKECKWYEKPHIKYNDGTKKYFDSEAEIEIVTADIGTNVGGQCIGHKTYCTAHDRENPEDYEELVIFRNTDDYCSYGERNE